MKSEDLTKEERIKKEISKLSRTFGKIDARTKKAVQSLIENAAFMAVTLADLQEAMNEEEGLVCKYQNGENQWGTKKSPEVEIYNTMIKNHASIIKQLTDLLPKPEPDPKGSDGFDEFVNDK